MNKNFDFIAGTSAGGILALAIGPMNMSLDSCSTVFKDFPAKVFRSVWTEAVFPVYSIVTGKPRYGLGELEKFLKEQFGQRKLLDCVEGPAVPKLLPNTHVKGLIGV